MKDCSMAANLPAIAKCLLAGSEEPAAELPTAVSRLHLLIILNVVKYDKAWAATVPLPTTYLLFSATGDDPEQIPIDAGHDNISFLTSDEFFDFKVSADIFVFSEFICYVSQVLNSHILTAANEDDVGLNPEQGVSEDVIVGKRG
jgi:hypothetical protein